LLEADHDEHQHAEHHKEHNRAGAFASGSLKTVINAAPPTATAMNDSMISVCLNDH
jgi:hypothetical protein